MTISGFFFGRKQKTSNGRRSSCGKLRCGTVRTRTLSMEPLETRDLLSVTTGFISASDYSALREQYSDFNLPEEQSTLNVMTIDLDEGATELKLEDLKSAIETAGTTTQSDLILVKTSASANRVTYTSRVDELFISINSSHYGSVTIIGWGEENFTLDANQQCRVMSVFNSSTVINLGGLTITGGSSRFSITINDYSGGGIYNKGTLTVINSTISDNIASFAGGGICNYSGTLTVTNSTISDNTASTSGGGIYNPSGTLTVTNSTISGNTGSIDGGGIYNSSGTLVVTNSTISDNTVSDHEGGGIYNSSSPLTITNSTIARNNSVYGGGLFDSGSTNVTIINCTISGNTASSGGGFYSDSTTFTVTNSTISGNTSKGTGGGIYNSGKNLTLTNCEISGNIASCSGGIYNFGQRNLTIISSTISGNVASNYIGGIYNNGGTLTLTNSIVSRNIGGNLTGSYSSNSSNNLIGGYDLCFVCPPQFDSDGKLTMDLHLRSDSNAIDKGSNTSVANIETDIDGNARIFGETVDIGVYEYQGNRNDEPILYSRVVNTLNDSFDLTDDEWSLREAIYYAPGNVTITFADNLEGTIVLTRGQLDISAPLSIDGDNRITIDADQKSRVFYVSAATALNGLTIQNGKASNGGGIFNSYGSLRITNSNIWDNNASSEGSGIYNYYGSLMITNSTISGNVAYCGGGIYNSNGYLTIKNSKFLGNVATCGGGIYSLSSNSTSTVTNCTISGNKAYSDGGGIESRGTNSTFMVTNCTISGNVASNGGGIYNSYPNLTIANSKISGNIATSGGGVYSTGSNSVLTVANCTISGNKANSDGGGIYYSVGTSVSANVNNTIIAYNSAPSDNDICKKTGSIYSYNSLSSYTAWDKGSKNIVYDPSVPLFVDAENGDYHLIKDSQAVDKGNNSYAVANGSSLAYDLDGAQRIVNGTVDIGAYEYGSYIILAIPSFTAIANETSATVNITPVVNAVAYRIEYSLNDKFTDSTTIDAQEGENVLNDLQFLQTYYVRVKSIGNDDFHDSNYSAAKSFMVIPALTGLTLSTDAPEVGSTIIATINSPYATVDYQWYSGETAIAGATDSSFTVTAEQYGQTITCVATGTGVYSGTVSATTAETVKFVTPDGYNDNDYQKMVAFLEQTDSDGVKNGTKLKAGYDPNDPSTWSVIEWVTVDGEKRISVVNFTYKSLVGTADFSDMTSLTVLWIYNNNLKSLNVSNCTGLTILDCMFNQLTSLNVSNCPAITELFCHSNQLTSLDVSSCSALSRLGCYSNNLISLNISGCSSLDYLSCHSNLFTSLDVSNFPLLTSLDCVSDSLETLNISGCTSLESFRYEGSSSSFTQLKTIDAHGCTSLQRLVSNYGKLISLDVSECSNLKVLDCNFNQLASLNLSDCSELTYLSCNSNNLTLLDLSKNINLTTLKCYFNLLTSLDLKGNAKLANLSIGDSNLSSVRLSNDSIGRLNISFYLSLYEITDSNGSYTIDNSNPYQPIEIPFTATSTSTGKTIVFGNEFPLSGLTLSSDDPVVGSTITAIVAPSDAAVEYQWYSGETAIEGATESTFTVTAKQFGKTITCVATGTGIYSETVSAATTATVRFATPDGFNDNDYQKMVAFLEQTNYQGKKNGTKLSSNYNPLNPSTWYGVYWTVVNGEKRIRQLEFDSSLHLVGHPDFSNMTSLVSLNCYNNQWLYSLDVSGCTSLQTLVCYKNRLDWLNVSGCTSLTRLSCYYNLLTSLDLSDNVNLTYLDCGNNQLTSLDVSKNTKLSSLYCSSNQLTSLETSNDAALSTLHCYNNQLASLNVSNNAALSTLHCYNNQLTSLDVSNNIALSNLYCDSNQFTSLNLTKNINLTVLGVDDSLSTVLLSSNSVGKLGVCFFNSSYSVSNSLETSTVEASSHPSSANYVYYQPTKLPFTAVSAATGKIIEFDDGLAISAQNDFVKTTLNSPVVIDYRENDNATDWSVVTVQFGEASHGEFAVNEDGTIAYTPENGFFGTDLISYVLVSASGKLAPGAIAVSVGLPIATSVQKTSSVHTPSTAMAPSVDSLTDWDNCCIELWAQGVSELNSGEATITLEYNPVVYAAPVLSDCADGAALSVSQSVTLPNGNVQVELTVETSQAIASQTDNLYLGTVVLTPSSEEGSGVEDGSNVPVCVLDGVELTTSVETMPYDMNHNGAIDLGDFISFATVFGLKLDKLSPDNPLYAQAVKADFNKDGIVNVDDFIAFSTNFGATKKSTVKPIPQASAAADSGNREWEVGNREDIDSQVEASNAQSATPNSQLVTPVSQLEVESSMTLREAYSAALLDLYDNFDRADLSDASDILAESRMEAPTSIYADDDSPKTSNDDAISAVLDEDFGKLTLDN